MQNIARNKVVLQKNLINSNTERTGINRNILFYIIIHWNIL